MVPQGMSRTVLLIMGMRDASCLQVVSAALESVPGVVAVDVSLFRSQATVIHVKGCQRKDLLTAVGQAGYLAAVRMK